MPVWWLDGSGQWGMCKGKIWPIFVSPLMRHQITRAKASYCTQIPTDLHQESHCSTYLDNQCCLQQGKAQKGKMKKDKESKKEQNGSKFHQSVDIFAWKSQKLWHLKILWYLWKCLTCQDMSKKLKKYQTLGKTVLSNSICFSKVLLLSQRIQKCNKKWIVPNIFSPGHHMV